MLTGESLPIDAGAGTDTFAGALGARARPPPSLRLRYPHKFGRTAELIRSAHVVSTQQKAVLAIVRNLAIFNSVLILVMAPMHTPMPWLERDHSTLANIGSCAIPVALPATFTLAAAIGARALGKQVYCQHGFPRDEAASIDVLCSDKTGTLTAMN